MSLSILTLIAVAAGTPSPGVGPDDVGPALGHRDLVAEHQALASEIIDLREGGPQAWPQVPEGRIVAMDGHGPTVAREVWGYLPYWSYSSSSAYIPARWDLLTVMAWFGVEMDGDGHVEDYHGWGSSTTEAIVNQAHAHGVKLVVTVTNFSKTEIARIVNDSGRRQAAITTCLDVIATHGADGINIDFEFVPLSARDGFVTFMAELKAAVTAAQPNGWDGHVSLAGPSVDWNGAYDYDVLLESTDGIMVMAYGYHWSQGDPGPISLLRGGNGWPIHSVAWTIDDYLTYGGQDNRHKVIIGLPWYGRNWPVANTDIPGEALGSGATMLFRKAEAEIGDYGRFYEDYTEAAYYHKTVDGQLRQVWYDDGQSFEAKLAYIDEQDLGGVGIWALGYEGGYPDLWDAIDTVFVSDGPTIADEDPIVEPAPDTSDGTDTAGDSDTASRVDAASGSDSGLGSETGAETGVGGGASGGTPGRSSDLTIAAQDDGCSGGRGGGWPLGLLFGLLFGAAALLRRDAKRPASG